MEIQKEIIKTFTKLGFIAFGGPAAHIAMLEEETINKKKRLSREKFLDFMGATNLIPDQYRIPCSDGSS
jgi:chromate transporter